MRILRMEIPMNFTMEFMEAEILKTIDRSENRQKLYVYVFPFLETLATTSFPPKQHASYMILVDELRHDFFTIEEAPYEIELYKDFYKSATIAFQFKYY